MKTIVKSLQFLRANLKTFILFEAAYKLMSLGILSPLLAGIYRLALYMAGIRYLTNNTLFSFLRTPSTIIFILLFILISSLFSIIEISGTIYAYHIWQAGGKFQAIDMIKHGFSTAFRILHPKNWQAIIFLILLIPITNIGLISGYVCTLEIPDFIITFIEVRRSFLILYAALLILLTLSAVYWMYSLHFFLLDKKSFHSSCMDSISFVHHHYLRTLLGILFWNLCILFLLVIFLCITMGVTLLVLRIFCSPKTSLTFSLIIFQILVNICVFLYSCFIIPIIFSYISVSFFQIRAKRNWQVCTPDFSKLIHLSFFRLKPLFELLLLLAFLIVSIFSYTGIHSRYFRSFQLFRSPKVTAHRGYSSIAPENTLLAFEAAKEHLSDWVELDLQQTKDGIIIVMHDSNFKRTTGYDANVWEVDYETVQTLDAGSFMGESFAGTPIPTFEEVIDYCSKENLSMNIELKSTGYETNLISEVVKQIQDRDFYDRCVITSFDYEILKEIKHLDSNIRTGYILSAAFSGIQSMKYADLFSLHYPFVTEQLVNTVHSSGKEVYAWTVNNPRVAQKLIDYSVDNIITDNPIMVQELIQSQNTNPKVIRLFKYLLGVEN